MNPNLWVRSDRLGVLDHELAFSFLQSWDKPCSSGTCPPDLYSITRMRAI
jgi:hypothetical protein